MSLRIIDNKRIDLTDDEFKLYQDICRSYDQPPNIFGADLFKDLFETDDRGFIVFLRPPKERMISMEIYMFLVSIMIHQHIGSSCTQVETLISEAKTLFEQMQNNILQASKIIEEGKIVISSLQTQKS